MDTEEGRGERGGVDHETRVIGTGPGYLTRPKGGGPLETSTTWERSGETDQ